MKSVLQNCLDRLPDEYLGNIDIYVSGITQLDEAELERKTKESATKVNSIHYFSEKEISEVITKVTTEFETVPEYSLKIDSARNWLKYSASSQEGIIVNISNISLAKLYNAYHTKGLFNLNIRKYIRNKKVDDGIKYTLDKNRENFWFLNNGLTIACEDFDPDGDTIKLYDFSIVNGGQTTTLIGNYSGSNDDEFFIPCKIVKSSEKLDIDKKYDFYNEIAEATNS